MCVIKITFDKILFFLQNLVICNAGLSTGLDQTALVSELTKFGSVSNVCLLRNKSYCFVVCADVINAQTIYRKCHAISRLGQNDTVIYLTYCIEGMFCSAKKMKRKLWKSEFIFFQFTLQFYSPWKTDFFCQSVQYQQSIRMIHLSESYRRVW